MTFSSVSSSMSASLSQKLFLLLLPTTMTLFAVHHISMTAASPLIPQKDDSVAVPMASFGRPMPQMFSSMPNSPVYVVFPANFPLERSMDSQNDAAEDEMVEGMGSKAKRAQTFVRFGKRAQTFVRFGKRAQTFVRFGRDSQRQQFDGKMPNEQQKQE